MSFFGVDPTGFRRRSPDIQLTLELDDRFVNMLAEGYDAVIRHGPVADKRIIVKRIAAGRSVLVASPNSTGNLSDTAPGSFAAESYSIASLLPLVGRPADSLARSAACTARPELPSSLIGVRDTH